MDVSFLLIFAVIAVVAAIGIGAWATQGRRGSPDDGAYAPGSQTRGDFAAFGTTPDADPDDGGPDDGGDGGGDGGGDD